uniref:U1 small nuclear ribonucleoprotein 70 kDa n=1 Tax=Strongyloides stercoralis TaxID=6248 RepID=A0AAF5DI75_STRER
MTQFLPDHLLGLFFPRPPLTFLPPIAPLLVEKDPINYDGMAQYISYFEDPKDTPAKEIVQTKEEKKAEKRKKKEELLAFKLEQEIAAYHTKDTSNFTEDPFKTLFVCKLSYETTESKLRREFSKWGTIVNIKIICTKDEKPRGYAFIEYSRKSEMSQAYKEADGIKIDGVRVLVDYERGRTRKDWLPRRLGGGKGKTRMAIEKKDEELIDDKAYTKSSSSHNGRREDKYSSRHDYNDRSYGGHYRSNDDRRYRDDRRDYDDRRKKYDRNNDFRRSNNKYDDNNRYSSSRSYKTSREDSSSIKRVAVDDDKNGPPSKRFYNEYGKPNEEVLPLILTYCDKM